MHTLGGVGSSAGCVLACHILGTRSYKREMYSWPCQTQTAARLLDPRGRGKVLENYGGTGQSMGNVASIYGAPFKSHEIMMFVCLQTGAKQCCDARKGCFYSLLSGPAHPLGELGSCLGRQAKGGAEKGQHKTSEIQEN